MAINYYYGRGSMNPQLGGPALSIFPNNYLGHTAVRYCTEGAHGTYPGDTSYCSYSSEADEHVQPMQWLPNYYNEPFSLEPQNYYHYADLQDPSQPNNLGRERYHSQVFDTHNVQYEIEGEAPRSSFYRDNAHVHTRTFHNGMNMCTSQATVGNSSAANPIRYPSMERTAMWEPTEPGRISAVGKYMGGLADKDALYTSSDATSSSIGVLAKKAPVLPREDDCLGGEEASLQDLPGKEIQVPQSLSRQRVKRWPEKSYILGDTAASNPHNKSSMPRLNGNSGCLDDTDKQAHIYNPSRLNSRLLETGDGPYGGIRGPEHEYNKVPSNGLKEDGTSIKLSEQVTPGRQHPLSQHITKHHHAIPNGGSVGFAASSYYSSGPHVMKSLEGLERYNSWDNNISTVQRSSLQDAVNNFISCSIVRLDDITITASMGSSSASEYSNFSVVLTNDLNNRPKTKSIKSAIFAAQSSGNPRDKISCDLKNVTLELPWSHEENFYMKILEETSFKTDLVGVCVLNVKAVNWNSLMQLPIHSEGRQTNGYLLLYVQATQSKDFTASRHPNIVNTYDGISSPILSSAAPYKHYQEIPAASTPLRRIRKPPTRQEPSIFGFLGSLCCTMPLVDLN